MTLHTDLKKKKKMRRVYLTCAFCPATIKHDCKVKNTQRHTQLSKKQGQYQKVFIIWFQRNSHN